MLELFKNIDTAKFISDSHLGHANVLRFEPIRMQFLKDHFGHLDGKISEANELIAKHSADRMIPDSFRSLLEELNEWHDKMVIEKWNSVVGENDTIFHLGDIAFKKTHLIERLNGKKYLIRGNHDLKDTKTYTNYGWNMIEQVHLNHKDRHFVHNLPLNKETMREDFGGCVITHSEVLGGNVLFSHFPVFDENEHDKKFASVTKQFEELYETFNCVANVHGHTHSTISVFGKAVNVSTELLNFIPKTLEEIVKKG